jgi:hypothetical protein
MRLVSSAPTQEAVVKLSDIPYGVMFKARRIGNTQLEANEVLMVFPNTAIHPTEPPKMALTIASLSPAHIFWSKDYPVYGYEPLKEATFVEE